MRQIIIARKDLDMSAGKLAAQVSHASMAFLSNMIVKNLEPIKKYETHRSIVYDPNKNEYAAMLYRHPDLYQFAKDAFQKGIEYFNTRPVNPDDPYGKLELCDNEIAYYRSKIDLDVKLYEEWLCGLHTKTICEAKNRAQLLKSVQIAQELGLKENEDYFLIYDACLTELAPEEVDENGNPVTLTCIGFKPLDDEVAWKISKKFQLYK